MVTPRRVLAPRAGEIAAALVEIPHAQPLDVLAAREIGSLLATLEAVDAALADGRVENKRGQVRHLLDVKARLSRQLREFGATPAARAEWAARLAQPSIRERVEAKLREIEADGAGDGDGDGRPRSGREHHLHVLQRADQALKHTTRRESRRGQRLSRSVGAVRRIAVRS